MNTKRPRLERMSGRTMNGPTHRPGPRLCRRPSAIFHQPCLSVFIGGLVLFLLLVASAARAQQRSLVPESFTLSDAATQAINAGWLTEEEQARLRLFHGVWHDADVRSATDMAHIALNEWRLDHPVFRDETVPRLLRAEANLRAGRLRRAIELLGNVRGNHAARIRAQAYEQLGELDAAARAIEVPVRNLLRERTDDAGELTEGVAALFIRSRLEGQPSRDFRTMLSLLARARQDLDRLYWPARLAEAEILIEKHHEGEAIAALHETLSLNPRCPEAWYMLGRIALGRFDFVSAATAEAALRRLRPQHPLAELLHARSRMIQDDPADALQILQPLIARWPNMREAHALIAAAHALRYDRPAMQAALDRYDALSPGSARAYYETGRHLSMNRQYTDAAAILDEAIRRQPFWPAPQIELGLMELQSGRDGRALRILREVTELDPFNKRAGNSLHLLEQLVTYETLETEHFILRYQQGIDEALVRLMPDRLERIYDIVTARFAFEPVRKTVIEVMPDHQRFSVRITGMPHIHTIAACTGPVIAMETPREGPRNMHLGTFDWPRVLQHEFTHTVTLGQTSNRIPHWLTEAAAVSMEEAPRDFERCLALARALLNDELFSLDEIKWAFVRPKRAGDRSLAYAQGHWMVQYVNERYGESALVRLLARYNAGEREEDALPAALGVTREAFFDAFREWAREEVKAWGLAPEPSLTELEDELRWNDPETALFMVASQQARLDAIVKTLTDQIGQPKTARSVGLTALNWPALTRPPVNVSDEQLEAWLINHPGHPDLLLMRARRETDRLGGADASVVPMFEAYAAARPVDMYPHRQLALYWDGTDTPARAIPHLEELDVREERTPVYAVKLARLYRAQGNLDQALSKVTRAVQIDPYRATLRELAAEIAVEAGDLDSAKQHIEALTLIEPDRPQHQRRLEAIDRLIDGSRNLPRTPGP